MIDYTAARSLVKLPPTEFLAKVEAMQESVSYSAGLVLQQQLRKLKNDSTLSDDVRNQGERLWRRACRLQVERVEQSKKQSALAGEANKTMLSSGEASLSGVQNTDNVGVDPLIKLLPSLEAYSRKQAAEKVWLKRHGSLGAQDWQLGTCDLCGRNDLVAQRLTPTGLYWLDFACYQGVDQLWQAPDAEQQFETALAAS